MLSPESDGKMMKHERDKPMKTITLHEHIDKKHNGSRAEFARSNGIKNRQQVTKMLNRGDVVIDGKRYSYRGEVE